MALHPAQDFTQDADDIEIGVVDDITPDYGTGGNQTRGDAANCLLWSKTDKDGNRVFDNPDFGNVLSIMQWAVNTPKDGWYESIWLRIQPYNAGANYVEEQSSGGEITQYASVFYYGTTGKVYKAIQPSTGQDPEDTDYFEEVDDLSTIIGNTNILEKITDFYVRTRASNCASAKMAKLDDCGCAGKKSETNQTAYYIDGLIIAADAAFEQGNPEEMENLMRQVESICSNC